MNFLIHDVDTCMSIIMCIRRIIILSALIFLCLVQSKLIAQDTLSPKEYNKKLRELRRQAKEYFWDLDKLETLLNLEAMYQQQIDSILASRRQIKAQLFVLEEQQNTILQLETKLNDLSNNLIKSENNNQENLEEISNLSLQLDSVRSVNHKLEKTISRLNGRIENYAATQSNYASADEESLEFINQNDRNKLTSIPVINSLNVNEEIKKLKEELFRTKIIAQQQSDVLVDYVHALEKELKKNGISYQTLYDDYQHDLDSVKSEIDFLSMQVVRRDSLRKKDSLLALKKIQAIQSAKDAEESARKLTEIRSTRNLIIFGVISTALLLILALIYRNYVQVSGQKKVIQHKNTILSSQNKEIRDQKAYIEEANENLKSSYHQITDSIRYAKTIQHAILPDPQIMKEFVKDYFILFEPKDIVSGDFYWVSKVKNRLYLAVIDCTGHGVPGAFMSMIGNTLLNKIISENSGSNPSIVLDKLNKEVIKNLQQEQSANNDGMDMVLCMLEKMPNQQTKVVFSGAKRPLYMITCQEKQLIEVQGNRKSIGGIRARKGNFKENNYILDAGTMMYLTTDGYADQNNVQRKKIGSLRLKELLSENSHLSMEDQHLVLSRFLEIHAQNTNQRDDITIIGVKV